MAAYAEGQRLWGERRQLEDHFADCDRCITLLVEVAAFRAEDLGRADEGRVDEGRAEDRAEDAQLRPLVPAASQTERGAWGRGARTGREGLIALFRRPPRLLWAASGSVALAAAMIVAFLIHEPARPGLDMLIAAVGDQRVTEARLVGFPHGRRPDVVRSAGDDGANPLPPLSLDAQSAVAAVREAATSDTPEARHALGMSRLMTGDLDGAIDALERATRGDPPSAPFLSDLAAAYLTRGTHRNIRPDLELALATATNAVDIDPLLLPARFNRALALDKLDQRARAHEAWNDYLNLDTTSAWADEARERAKP